MDSVHISQTRSRIRIWIGRDPDGSMSNQRNYDSRTTPKTDEMGFMTHANFFVAARLERRH